MQTSIRNTTSKADELLVGTKRKKYLVAIQNNHDIKRNIIYQFDTSKENQPYQNERNGNCLMYLQKMNINFGMLATWGKKKMTSILGRLDTYIRSLKWTQNNQFR